MLFTPIYIAMTFIKTWRIRSFRARLLEFLNGNTSVAFCKVPENAAETPTLSSKLCTNPKNAYLCDLLHYTNTTRICSMKPTQCIEISDWVSCSGGLPLGSSEQSPVTDLDVDVLFECEMEPHEGSSQQDIITLESMGQPMAWKAGSHLAIVVKTNIEKLSVIGFNFVGGEFVIDHKLPVVRVQTVQLSGEANKATDPAMRSIRSEVQHGLKVPPEEFQWPIHAALLRKLSKVVDIKSDVKHTVEMNGSTEITLDTPRKHITLADVSCSTGKSLGEEEPVKLETKLTESVHKTPEKSPEKKVQPEQSGPEEVVLENVTVEIQHNITPKKSSLKLDLKKGTSSLSTSLLNISSQIKSVTTHKRIVSTTKKQPPQIESSVIKEESQKESPQQSTPKSAKCSRPLVNTKSPNVLIYSDSVAARDNLEASLRKVLDCDRYILYSVSKETLEAGAWRGRAALVAVAGCVGRGAPLLLAHLLDGGRLLALCSDLLHTVLPYYKTAEVRENEVVQFSFDKWKSVKMKHHIFCYQASPAKKQFSTESDRQPSKYTGHPGHELDIQVLASEETWRTPSLLQATDLTNNGIAIFSQIHLEADPSDYLGEEGIKSNEARLEIIHKILGDILGLHVREPSQLPRVEYTRGFFLGNHVHKLSLVEKWCGGASPRLQKLGAMTLQWCLRDEAPLEPPAPGFLPVHVYECPEHFSTVEYYTHLTSSQLGRVVVYADVLSSTLNVTGTPLAHGVACVARRQTAGRGRTGNAWLTPARGQAAISVQVWQKVTPSLPLVQHASALAVVRALRSQPAYEHLEIRIKWPNDIYYGREVKIGGTATEANCTYNDVVINIGTGVNITNSQPTMCVNDIIAEHNKRHGTNLAPISVERFLARYCSELERTLEYMASDGGVQAFLEQYYQYWLHTGEEIRVLLKDSGTPVAGCVAGVDEAGWLLVATPTGELRVAPDGNTFDMMAGLVAPKM
ncbi:LOW QUALITY PROTEIN: biotin--protein ligase [Ostrinia furnacalis]|uniref:LOW QUALITY PROTEIN: biotin--protein ligase n=1 Tax=Ostrinia furnacalis TaxID=93504 RepID=UPI00103A5772|nr:LOW QUALITY PROTEIN: biotin--protein ligase [Ostrinia furnacalis]